MRSRFFLNKLVLEAVVNFYSLSTSFKNQTNLITLSNHECAIFLFKSGAM